LCTANLSKHVLSSWSRHHKLLTFIHSWPTAITHFYMISVYDCAHFNQTTVDIIQGTSKSAEMMGTPNSPTCHIFKDARLQAEALAAFMAVSVRIAPNYICQTKHASQHKASHQHLAIDVVAAVHRDLRTVFRHEFTKHRGLRYATLFPHVVIHMHSPNPFMWLEQMS